MFELTKEQNLIAGLEALIVKLKAGELTVVNCEQREVEAGVIEHVPLSSAAYRRATTETETEYTFRLKKKS